MRAIRIYRFGDPEVMELNEVPVPPPGENELLVRIHAASMNPIDYKISRGAVPGIRHALEFSSGRCFGSPRLA